MRKLFSKQIVENVSKRQWLIIAIIAVILAGLVAVYVSKSQKPFVYDAAAGKQQIEKARNKIYEKNDYQAAIDILAQEAKHANPSAKYNILIEEGSYQFQTNQLERGRDTFEEAKQIGGNSNAMVGVVLGTYYLQVKNKTLAKENFLAAKQSLERKPNSDLSKKSALANINSQLQELENEN